ncbi:MAG: aminotransferase class V-fold PLP-dependent enzyme, partial [Patescibacteria group bacterium]
MLENSWKSQFPFLTQEKNGQPLAYFDNACMTPCPVLVLEAMEKYNKEFFSCGGRSNTRFGRKVDDKVAETREIVAKFIGAGSPQEIIFTKNTTEGINLVARGLNWQAGERVLVSDREHNSNLIIWQVLQKERGIELFVLPSKNDETFDLAGLEAELQKGVKLVSLVYSSNLDGYTLPVEEIVKLARKYDALVMLDGAQAAPHHAINVKKLGVDFLAFSGHKMLAPSGTGVLYGR